MKRKVKIRWLTKNKECKDKIREKLGIPLMDTINGTVEFYLREEDIEWFLEIECRGFVRLMQNGV